MNSLLSKTSIIRNNINLYTRIGLRAMSGGEAGSGAGKGGGTGGSIRDAGGAFGKMEVAHEEQYMRKLQQEQLKALKKSLEKEVDFHKDQINAHKKALERHKDRLEDLSETPKK